jgi:MOSC domain-containing protein YiiM
MKLIGIAIRQRKQAPMQTLQQAQVSPAQGIEGDFKRKPGKRQITVLSVKQWQLACNEINANLPWTIRRANLLVDGIEFCDAMLGKRLKIGDIELQIMAETEPCHKMDEQSQGLRAALTPNWRGGVCCQVISGGEINTGDTLTFT